MGAVGDGQGPASALPCTPPFAHSPKSVFSPKGLGNAAVVALPLTVLLLLVNGAPGRGAGRQRACVPFTPSRARGVCRVSPCSGPRGAELRLWGAKAVPSPRTPLHPTSRPSQALSAQTHRVPGRREGAWRGVSCPLNVHSVCLGPGSSLTPRSELGPLLLPARQPSPLTCRLVTPPPPLSCSLGSGRGPGAGPASPQPRGAGKLWTVRG